MLLFLLLISLVVLLSIAYFISGRDILSPWIISIYMFIITVFVALLNTDNWNVDISGVTILVVLSGLIFFGAGEIYGKSILRNNSRRKINDLTLLNGGREIKIKNIWIIISVIFIGVVIYFYFMFIKRIAFMAGNRSGLELMIHYARNAQFDDSINTDQSMLLNLGIIFSRAISYIFIFVFLYNTVFFKFKTRNLKYLIPVLLNVANIILSTGRTQFINIITVFLILLFIMVKQKYLWSKKLNRKIIIYGALGIIFFLVIFRLSGYSTGKSTNYGVWANVSKYLGAPIVALDKYLNNPPPKDFFGKETFSSIYHVLRKFGCNIPTYSVPNEFISWENLYNVNIYTAFRRYIQDFSIFGMLLIQFLLGILYGSFYQFIKYNNKVGLALIIYATNFYPIVQMAIEERFFMNIISISGIYNLMAIFAMWHFFLNKKSKTRLKWRVRKIKGN